MRICMFNKWGFHNTNNFVYTNCYKVIGCDPNDEIIPESASLRSGITREIFRSEIERKKKHNKFNKQNNAQALMLHKKNYFHIINEHETTMLFTQLRTFYGMLKEYASPDGIDKHDLKSSKLTKIPPSPRSQATALSSKAKTSEGDELDIALESPGRMDEFNIQSEQIKPLGGDIGETEGYDAQDTTAPLETERDEDIEDSFTMGNPSQLSILVDQDDADLVNYAEKKELRKNRRRQKKITEKAKKYSLIDNKEDPTDYHAINHLLVKTHVVL